MAAAQECRCAGVEDGPLRDVPAIAAHLAVSERFVRGLIATGNLKAHKLSPKVLRICKHSLQAYLDACLTSSAPEEPPADFAPRLRSVPTARKRSPSRTSPSVTPWNRLVA